MYFSHEQSNQSTRVIVRQKELSDNGFTFVHKCYDRKEKIYCASKTLLKAHHKNWKNELSILQLSEKNELPHVVRYLHCFSQNEIYITFFMELCDGTLKQFIENEPVTQSYHDKMPAQEYFQSNPLELMHQTAKGLLHLHQIGILHRDLKPSNVLLVRKTQCNTVAKIADFGISKTLPPGISTASSAIISTATYRAKECCDKVDTGVEPHWKKSSDMFSYGVMLYYALTKTNPYGRASADIASNILNGQLPNFKVLRNDDQLGYSKESKTTIIDLIKRLISHNPETRLTAEQVLKHPTFYTSKAKINFLTSSFQRLDKKLDSDSDLDWYDAGLMIDDQSGSKKFFIDKEVLPGYFVSRNCQLKEWADWKFEPCLENINSNDGPDLFNWLRVLQNKYVHARHPKMPEDFRKDLCMDGDPLQPDPKKFLDFFISNQVPFTLVHLYEHFRGAAKNDNELSDFYPEHLKNDEKHAEENLTCPGNSENKPCTSDIAIWEAVKLESEDVGSSVQVKSKFSNA